MKKPIPPALIGVVVVLFVGVLGFFGFRSLNDSNIHSYDEATPEQRKAFIESSNRGFSPPDRSATSGG